MQVDWTGKKKQQKKTTKPKIFKIKWQHETLQNPDTLLFFI